MGFFLNRDRNNGKTSLEELRNFFIEFFGAAGPLLLRKEMRRLRIESFTQADEEMKSNFVENIITLMYPSLVSLQKAKILKVRLYTILNVSRKRQQALVEKESVSKPLEKREKETVTQELADVFIQYFGPPGPLLLRQAMEEKKITAIEELDDEERLGFIEEILDNMFSELLSQGKIKVLRSELISIFRISEKTKAAFYRRGQAGFEATAGDKIIPS